MARREVGEINAGSMADIAFLLLIFFLVTTTMEVDAGIGRNLPQKLESDVEVPPVHDRDILVIMANSRDELLVENEPLAIEMLEDKVNAYYRDNMDGRNLSLDMPEWQLISVPKIKKTLADLQAQIDANPNDNSFDREYTKWEKKLAVCEVTGGSYMEMSKSAIIQLKNQAKTSYGLYIEIHNILKRVVNKLRQEKCDELGWGEYMSLDRKDPDDIAKIDILRVLIPERVIEAKIDR